jgi:hypothetical protein
VVFEKTYFTVLPSRAANRQIHSAYTPAAAKMNEINPKYENTRKIHRLLTNQNPGFLYKV